MEKYAGFVKDLTGLFDYFIFYFFFGTNFVKIIGYKLKL